jgi:signal recognition particle receptor subunit beta
MGNSLGGWWGKVEKRTLILTGPNNSGKTTILYKLKLGEEVVTLPCVQLNPFEEVNYSNVTVCEFDSSIIDHEVYRNECIERLKNTTHFAFIVDSASQIEDIDAAAQALEKIEQYLNSSVPLLIFANKQDLPATMSLEEISFRLKLQKYSRPWRIVPTIAVSGEGLFEGLNWLLYPKDSTFDTPQKIKNARSTTSTTI